MGWPIWHKQHGGISPRTLVSMHPPTNPNVLLSNGANLPPTKAEVNIPQDPEYGLKAKTILKVEIKK